MAISGCVGIALRLNDKANDGSAGCRSPASHVGGLAEFATASSENLSHAYLGNEVRTTGLELVRSPETGQWQAVDPPLGSRFRRTVPRLPPCPFESKLILCLACRS